MVDAFALLGHERLPWVDAEKLRADFHRLSDPIHPDRTATEPETVRAESSRRYAELNAAYQTLKEPKDRLRCLMELESGSPPRDIQRIPPGTMDLFVEIGQTCRDVDPVIASRTEITSPMLKLQRMQETMQWTARLQDLQRKVNTRRDACFTELSELNEVWKSAPSTGPTRMAALPLERLEQVYRSLSYIQRWTSQIQDRIVELMTH